jgi:hypothetical protein
LDPSSFRKLTVHRGFPQLNNRCCNLAAVLLWALVADKLGRRYIVTGVQTLVCVILFVVGGLYYKGASNGNVAAGTGLVSSQTQTVGLYRLVDLHVYLVRRRAGDCAFILRLLRRATFGGPTKYVYSIALMF